LKLSGDFHNAEEPQPKRKKLLVSGFSESPGLTYRLMPENQELWSLGGAFIFKRVSPTDRKTQRIKIISWFRQSVGDLKRSLFF